MTGEHFSLGATVGDVGQVGENAFILHHAHARLVVQRSSLKERLKVVPRIRGSPAAMRVETERARSANLDGKVGRRGFVSTTPQYHYYRESSETSSLGLAFDEQDAFFFE